MALLSSSASASKASIVKNKGLIAEAYQCDEEVSSDDNEMVEVKVLMALAKDNDAVSKEGAINGEWVKISTRKIHTLIEMEDNYDRKNYLDYLDYLCIDLNYVEWYGFITKGQKQWQNEQNRAREWNEREKTEAEGIFILNGPTYT
ncbi:hypothetical protein Tco_1260484, partial [Tanacetum coccineum]